MINILIKSNFLGIALIKIKSNQIKHEYSWLILSHTEYVWLCCRISLFIPIPSHVLVLVGSHALAFLQIMSRKKKNAHNQAVHFLGVESRLSFYIDFLLPCRHVAACKDSKTLLTWCLQESELHPLRGLLQWIPQKISLWHICSIMLETNLTLLLQQKNYHVRPRPFCFWSRWGGSYHREWLSAAFSHCSDTLEPIEPLEVDVTDARAGQAESDAEWVTTHSLKDARCIAKLIAFKVRDGSEISTPRKRNGNFTGSFYHVWERLDARFAHFGRRMVGVASLRAFRYCWIPPISWTLIFSDELFLRHIPRSARVKSKMTKNERFEILMTRSAPFTKGT
jgi:hypothetical protein